MNKIAPVSHGTRQHRPHRQPRFIPIKTISQTGYFRSFPPLSRHNFAADKNLRNMKKNPSVNFRADWFEAIEAFPEDKQFDAYRAIMRYAFYGEIPSDPSIKMAIGLIMHLIDKHRATRKTKDATKPTPTTEAPAQPSPSNTPTQSGKQDVNPFIYRDSGGWSASGSFQRIRRRDAGDLLLNKPEASG